MNQTTEEISVYCVPVASAAIFQNSSVLKKYCENLFEAGNHLVRRFGILLNDEENSNDVVIPNRKLRLSIEYGDQAWVFSFLTHWIAELSTRPQKYNVEQLGAKVILVGIYKSRMIFKVICDDVVPIGHSEIEIRETVLSCTFQSQKYEVTITNEEAYQSMIQMVRGGVPLF